VFALGEIEVIYHGDLFDVLPTLSEASVDACVTDPPYDLTSGKKGGSGAASVNLDSPYGRARIGTGNGAGVATSNASATSTVVSAGGPLGGVWQPLQASRKTANTHARTGGIFFENPLAFNPFKLILHGASLRFWRCHLA